jgi:hypothetical protein
MIIINHTLGGDGTGVCAASLQPDGTGEDAKLLHACALVNGLTVAGFRVCGILQVYAMKMLPHSLCFCVICFMTSNFGLRPLNADGIVQPHTKVAGHKLSNTEAQAVSVQTV